MGRSIRVLLIEDREDDALLAELELRRGGYTTTCERAETAAGVEAALARGPWHLVISDWSMPRFTGLDALRIVRSHDVDVPFLIVSGTLGEENAVSAMRAGANDFIVKGRLGRLVPAVERELREAAEREARRRAEDALRASEAETRIAHELAETRAVMLASLERERAQLARLNCELEAARAQAARESAFKSKFLASMSHELRTPLNAIIGFSELLHLEIPGPLTLLQKDYVQNVLGSGEHLLTLINDILDISKIEAGHMELRLALQPLGAAVDGVSGSAHALAAKRGVSLEIDLAKDLPEMMLDLVRIKQILLNLLSNAIKFTQPGGKVVLRAVASQELVSISVSDTGIGIKNEDLPRLFREFEQIHAGAMSANGTGLGLALTRKLAELHGGRVRVESEFGRGSTFTVDLPTGRNVAKSQAPVKDQGGLPGSAILVVEDDPKAAELLATHLRSAGWSVAVALDAEAAMEKARALRPAAITIDLLMPNVDGWNMLTRLKADPETAAIPVVVVSAVEEPNRGLVLGAADHLVKPVSRDALLRSLAAVGVVAHGLRTDLQKGG